MLILPAGDHIPGQDPVSEADPGGDHVLHPLLRPLRHQPDHGGLRLSGDTQLSRSVQSLYSK